MADKDSPAQPSGTVAVNGRAAAGEVGVTGGHAAGHRSAKDHPGGAAAEGKAVNGKVAKRDSDEIVAEIERTRQNLARTIDTLADRVSPSSNMRRLREQVAEQMAKPEVQLAALAVGLAVTGIVILRIWGRRRA
ncbi:MAG TPA: DUF3618 domain-containing protein [Streptosporangiaceae bacterium]|nr:DUF3618 domain-containing protein [Streptosporangiaceae bacterium]